MQSQVPNASAAEPNLAVNDLGPLAWVLDELRKSLESAAKALKRFVWDAEAARGSDLAAIDVSPLRIARQQLHQAVGALEMVGLPAAAPVLRAMEAAVQKFIGQPEQCNHDAVAKIEHASFAVTEYLEDVLAGKAVSSVSLFPQYREVQMLLRADRIHPADLWPAAWRWLEPQLTVMKERRSYDASARAVLDQAILKLMKGKSPQAARQLAGLSLEFSAGQPDKQIRIFWSIAAAYFEALAHDLLVPDLYVRRAASRILLQYASLAKGDTSISERLAQDLLFFCAQAAPAEIGADENVHALSAVRLAYGLTDLDRVDYELVQFGRFDPALLAQARKRITLAKEGWSSLCAGDISKFKSVADQFSLVAESLLKLHPQSEPLAHALSQAVEGTVRAAHTPRIELAMEVATAVLYLEAAFHDLDPNDSQLTIRTADLAQRLEAVTAGGEPQPLESWMEALYRRVSDKQTMGSVVGELKVSLGELEKALDIFFRNPQDKTTLQAVPGKLSQMRGVLSVLGLDQASRAVSHMSSSVEKMLDTEIDEQQARSAGTFEHLGNNLGALSFLIDMLSYQPVLAKKLFVYDEARGELKPLMGRAESVADKLEPVIPQQAVLAQALVSVVHEASVAKLGDAFGDDFGVRLDALATQAALAEQPELARNVRDAALAVTGTNDGAAANALLVLSSSLVPAPEDLRSEPAAADLEEDDLQAIFLEEALEVIGQAREAIEALEIAPNDEAPLTVLRRGFHTLKGSARMVGLNEFGEAAWGFEQLVNSWLADQKPATRDFRTLSSEGVSGLGQWIADIAANQPGSWSAEPFRLSAQAMRIDERYFALNLSDSLPALKLDANLDLDLELALPASPHSAFDFLSAPLPSQAPAETATDTASVADAKLAAFDIDSLFDAPDRVVLPSVATLDEVVADAEAPPEPEVNIGSAEDETADEGTEAVELSAAEFDRHFDVETLTLRSEAQFVPAQPPPALTQAAQTPHQIEPAAIVAQNEFKEDVGPDEDARLDDADDEKTRVIGGLRIGIALYNVYLNEADEWSRRLVTEIAEWALEGHQRVGASTVALAHSLAGSSATVGFGALSDMARALEHALEKSSVHHSHGAAMYGQVFVDASEDIRRLLHQFAAGFLKQPEPGILARLNALEFGDSALPELELKGGDARYAPDEFADELAEEFADADESHLAMRPEAPSDDEPETSRAAPSRPDLLPPDSRPVVSYAVVFPGVQATPLTAFMPMRMLGGNDEGDDAEADLDADGVDAIDAIDPDLFPIFEDECTELMPQLGGALRQWSSRPENKSARLEVLRVLHTLKGSARLAGALRLGEMAHRMESEIEFLGSELAASQEFEPLLSRFDRMQTAFDRLRLAEAEALAAPAQAEVQALTLNVQSAFDSTAPEHMAELSQPKALLAEPAADLGPAGLSAEPLAPVPPQPSLLDGQTPKVRVPAPLTMAMQPLRQAATASVRVRSQLLDRMVNQAGEVMITRSRLEAEIGQLRGSLNDMTGNLNRLRQQLRDIELQAESQMQSRLAQAKEAQAGFDPLEFDRFTRVQELTRMMAESVNDVATVQRTLQRTVEATEDDLIAQGRQTRELQRDLLRTRMVEFEGISDRLYRVVRLASKETGKQVRLDLLGGTIEMDRGMLDRMTPAFEHLLRNCVAHGIESPQARAEAGKDPIGLITVHLRQEGNDVAVDFSDDGGGLDLNRIREKAVSLGLLLPGQTLDAQEAANLIFTPGFSTATEVTELSGRGIGMDVVRSEVNALGGRIETATVTGQGSHFKLVLPLTTAVTQVVMIRAGTLSVGVPANMVETVRRVSALDLQQAYSTGSYDMAGEAIPFYWAGAMLQASNHSSEAQSKTSPVVVFKSAAQRIAMHVDEVLGNREVVVKNLGPQLSRLPGLAGMSVLASGAVVLIYNPVALAAIYGEQARKLSADWNEPLAEAGNPAGNSIGAGAGAGAGAGIAASMVPPQSPLILVVDDSITVRRVTQRLLLREGYRVALAADGLQALERLLDERPAVVLSDIEMPRMDGFDLARNIRADRRLKDLPIVMITSRIAEKHRQHARELGVNHYLGKPYSEEELISLVRHYCSQEAAVLV